MMPFWASLLRFLQAFTGAVGWGVQYEGGRFICFLRKLSKSFFLILNNSYGHMEIHIKFISFL